jgi:hypothetical protein
VVAVAVEKEATVTGLGELTSRKFSPVGSAEMEVRSGARSAIGRP